MADDVAVSYPEIRRIARDALKAIGYPPGIIEEAAEHLVWTEASYQNGLKFLDDEARAWPAGTRRQARGPRLSDDASAVDCAGFSLLEVGARLFDYVTVRCMESTTRHAEIVAVGVRGVQFLPYLAVSTAQRGYGFTVLYSSAAPDSGTQDSTVSRFSARPGVAGVTVSRPADGSLNVAVDSDTARIFCYPVTRTAESRNSCTPFGLLERRLDTTDVVKRRLSVRRRDYELLIRLSQRLRVPTSERSRAQAG